METIRWGKFAVAKYGGDNLVEIEGGLAAGNVDGVLVKKPSEENLGLLFNSAIVQGTCRIVVLQGLTEAALNGFALLARLEEVSADDIRSSIDLSRLPNLRTITLYWRENILQNAGVSGVQCLRVWKYKSRTQNLTPLPEFPMLRRLELNQSPIHSLFGINKYRHLEYLEFNYLTRIEFLSELNLSELRQIVATHCKKLSDHHQLAGCQNLETIRFLDCGAIQSLRFVGLLKRLKTLRLIRTRIPREDLHLVEQVPDSFYGA